MRVTAAGAKPFMARVVQTFLIKAMDEIQLEVRDAGMSPTQSVSPGPIEINCAGRT